MGEFIRGVIAGAAGASLIFALALDNAEARCERKHNVYDCELAVELFVPSPSEATND